MGWVGDGGQQVWRVRVGPSSQLGLVEPSQPRLQGGLAWVGGARGTKAQ